MRGFGTVYPQPGSRFYWIQYYRNGVRHRESSGTDKYREAQKILKARISSQFSACTEPGRSVLSSQPNQNPEDAAFYRPSSPGGLTVAGLYEAMERNYAINGRKSLDDLRSLWKNHLQPALGAIAAHALDSDGIERYVVERQKQGAANASINRELAALKRMYRLGKKAKKVKDVPWIETLKESNARTGFVRDDKYSLVARETAKIGLWLRAMMEVGYNHGWRKNELLTRRVRHFDGVARTLSLDPGETKNDEPRTVPLMGVEFELIQQCCAGKGPDEFLFTRENGDRVSDYRDDWARACCNAGVGHMTCKCGGEVTPAPADVTVKPPRPGAASARRLLAPAPGDPACKCGAAIRADNKAGICWSCQLAERPVQAPRRWTCACGVSSLWGELRYRGLLFHDLRRTASNNMIRAGLSEKQAMAHTGHLTNATFKRYHIVDPKQMQESLVKMEKAAADRRREATQQELFNASSQLPVPGTQQKPERPN